MCVLVCVWFSRFCCVVIVVFIMVGLYLLDIVLYVFWMLVIFVVLVVVFRYVFV